MDERLFNQHALEKQLKENYDTNYINNTNNISPITANNFNTYSHLNNKNYDKLNSISSKVNFPTNPNNNNKNKDSLLLQDSNKNENLLNQNSKAYNDLKTSNSKNHLNNILKSTENLNNSQQQNENNNNDYKKYQSHQVINTLNAIPECNNSFYNTEKNSKQALVPSKSHNALSFKFPSTYNNNKNKNQKNKSNFLKSFENRNNSNFLNITKTPYLTQTPNHKLFILDNIIENLQFSKHHLALVLLCACNMLMDGYLNLIIKKFSILTIKIYKWEKKHNTNFLLAQQLFMALGALISTNTRSIHWDVRSNTLVSLIGAIALLLIHFYTDAVSFCALLFIYSLCHGFISNICTNYLLELVNIKYRSFLYCFVFSFKIFGMFIGVGFVYAFSENNRIDNPCIYTIGLPVGEFILCFLLFFNIDSLRMLFYSDEIGLLFDLLQEIDFIDEFTGVKYFDVDLHKKNYVVKLDDKLFDFNFDLVEKEESLLEINFGKTNNNNNNNNNSYSCYNNYNDESSHVNLNVRSRRTYDDAKDSEDDDDYEEYKSNYNYLQVPGRNTTKLNIDKNELRTKLLEAKSSNSNILSPVVIQEKKFNIPIYEDDQAHLYFNPILTDDFLFKKAILKRFEQIKISIEKKYGVQENHGVFNSFYILLTKKHYVNTLTSIFFILFSTLIFINVHFVYPELDFYKSKYKVDKSINDPNYIELNIINLNNKQLVFYFFALFVCFNLLGLIQHVILSFVMHYDSIFAYDSVKNLEKHLDEKDKKLLGNEEVESESENIFDLQQAVEEKELFVMEDFVKKIQKSLKEKSKSEIIFAAKVKVIIHLFCLLAVLTCIACFMILKHQNIYILFVFDLFMLYYSCLIYYHFSEKSTTLLRNCTTSVMYVTVCFCTIAQNFVELNVSFIGLLVMCFVFGLVLIVFDWLLIDHAVSFKGLQKIEFSIMKKHKK